MTARTYMLTGILFIIGINATPESESVQDITATILNYLQNEEATRDCNTTTQVVTSNVITAPGFYCLGQNLTFNGIATTITIQTSFVILDLASNVFKAATTGSGIVVTGNPSYVVIQNGAIINAGTNAISVAAGASNIAINNITALNNNTGFNVAGTNNVIINNCQAFNTANEGFLINTCISPIISNCVSNNNNIGFSLLNCTDGSINRCVANGNLTTGFNQLINIASITSSNANYSNCIANENVTGFSILDSENNLRACAATQNAGDGFVIGGINNTLISCISKLNANRGFLIQNDNHNISECIASKNIGNGFTIHGNRHTILNSIAQQNLGNGILLNAASGVLTVSNQCQVRYNSLLGNTLFGINNLGTLNRIYTNFASDNTGGNFSASIPNVAVSPTAVAAINSTANIAN